MPEFVKDSGFLGLFAFFFAIVFFRTQVTYWIARYVSFLSVNKREIRNPTFKKVADWIRVSGEGQGVRTIDKWGVFAVFGSFFMTGTKTVVNAGAGLAQMRFVVYIVPMVLGCIAHGIIYATIGWAAWTAVLKAVAGSPWAAGAIVIAVAALACWWGRRRRAARLEREQAITSARDALDS